VNDLKSLECVFRTTPITSLC